MNIKVSELFYSLQGEGKTVGMPSVFLRTTGCMLDCKWCDTTEVWRHGIFYTIEDLLSLFRSSGFLDVLRQNAHLILTGGDPLIQQQQLYYFLVLLMRELTPIRPIVEVETEGVLMPETLLATLVSWFNVSPKLENSGVSLDRRYKQNVLRFHAKRSEDIFKFAVSREEDVFEAMKWVEFLEVPRHRVWIMPICSSRKEQDDVGPM